MVTTREQLAEALRLHNWWEGIPRVPTPKQHAFLWLQEREVLYGGQVGGGKSDGILMGALQDVDHSHYRALILRRRLSDLRKSNALIDRSREWLAGTGAVYNASDYVWTFPSGARIEFGYLTNDKDLDQYQSAEYHFIGWDELTHFPEKHYTYMFSRCRKNEGDPIPLRIRSGTNPGGVGHEWVKERWKLGNEYADEPRDPERVFIPAGLDDNPYLASEEYVEMLGLLDATTRARLMHGDWDVVEAGNFFKRSWFPIDDAGPKKLRKLRYWDLASTEPDPEVNPDPDYIVGGLIGLDNDGITWVLDIRRDRLSPHKGDRMVANTAAEDGKRIPIWIEEEPGSSGKRVTSYMQRKVLAGYQVRGHRPTGDKLTRARAVSAQAEAGNVRLVRAPWNKAFLDELEQFDGEDGDGKHDDQVDVLSGGYDRLTQKREVRFS